MIIVYLDLDRTLYRTAIATREKWRVLGGRYPQIDIAAECARQHDFYVHDGDAYAYDFSAHIAAIGLDVAEVYTVLRESELADGRLEYDGVAALVAHARTLGEVQILTYGIDDYQRLKASLCPSLASVPVVTTLRPKGEFLQDKGDVWLVDDKPLADALPQNVRFIRVCHDTNAPGAVTSLADVISVLQE